MTRQGLPQKDLNPIQMMQVKGFGAEDQMIPAALMSSPSG
jgi:hypothetical protein